MRLIIKTIMISLIAEYKRASPSQGDINLDISVEEVVQKYQAMGAQMLSILTNEPLFNGNIDFIRRAKAVSSLPILRKDFITTQQQISESKAAGADVVLLIAALLDNEQLRNFIDMAHGLELQALLEVHDKAELHRAIALSPDMIGINSRNLQTLEIDLSLFDRLVKEVPDDVFLVAESGLRLADLPRLEALGFDAALVGTSLMKSL